MVAEQELAAAKAALKPDDAATANAVAAAEKKVADAATALAAAHAALAEPSADVSAARRTIARNRAPAAGWPSPAGSPIARTRSPPAWRSTTSGCGTSARRSSTTCSTSACAAPQPRNQPLLDWLAVELMDHGWQMKHIHRLIVTSNAYRMASTPRARAPRISTLDRDNHYLWRMNTRRLEAEAGPRRRVLRRRQSRPHARRPGHRLQAGLDHAAPQHLFPARLRKADRSSWSCSTRASVNECYRRSESIVPQQALALANSDVSLNAVAAAWPSKLSEQSRQATPSRIRRSCSSRSSRSSAATHRPRNWQSASSFLTSQAELLARPGQADAHSPAAPKATVAAVD